MGFKDKPCFIQIPFNRLADLDFVHAGRLPQNVQKLSEKEKWLCCVLVTSLGAAAPPQP